MLLQQETYRDIWTVSKMAVQKRLEEIEHPFYSTGGVQQRFRAIKK